MKKLTTFLVATLSILTVFSVSAKEEVDKIGDEVRLVSDTRVSTITSGWHPNFSHETKKLLCFQNLVKYSTGYGPIDYSIKAEAGTIFKIISTKTMASDNFLDAHSFGSQGITIIKLKSNSKDFDLELNCHTKEKYYYEKNSLANAPTVENVLEIFKSTIN